jgi:hypothetical protein
MYPVECWPPPKAAAALASRTLDDGAREPSKSTSQAPALAQSARAAAATGPVVPAANAGSASRAAPSMPRHLCRRHRRSLAGKLCDTCRFGASSPLRFRRCAPRRHRVDSPSAVRAPAKAGGGRSPGRAGKSPAPLPPPARPPAAACARCGAANQPGTRGAAPPTDRASCPKPPSHEPCPGAARNLPSTSALTGGATASACASAASCPGCKPRRLRAELRAAAAGGAVLGMDETLQRMKLFKDTYFRIRITDPWG